MPRFKLGAAVLLTAFTVAAQPVQAQLAGPVPTNAYIVLGGLDWAWACPLPAPDCAFNLTDGWALPTATQLLSAPTALQFLFAGANVPFNGVDPVSGSYFSALNAAYTAAGSAGACAATYFTPYFSWCDWFNGLGQDNDGNGYTAWAGMPDAPSYADQLVVRVDAGNVVPEPATMTMLATGLVGMVGAGLRRRKRA